MSVKLHFLRPLFDNFPKKCRYFIENQGEHFHQKIYIIDECYQDMLDVNFLAEYCWCLKWDAVAADHGRISLKRPFIHE